MRKDNSSNGYSVCSVRVSPYQSITPAVRMTSEQFRRIAMRMPEAVESAHMGHPDFRVNGKIFATLFSRDGINYGMLKLKPDQQLELVRDYPDAFALCAGAWGRGGATQVRLHDVNKKMLKRVSDAMLEAWCNAAPKRLVEQVIRQSSDPHRE